MRFISARPLLGPVDLRAYTCLDVTNAEVVAALALRSTPPQIDASRAKKDYGKDSGALEFCPSCGASEWEPVCPDCNHYMVQHHPDTPSLDWVIDSGQIRPRRAAHEPAMGA